MKKILPLIPFFIFFALAGVFYMSIGRDPTLTANALVGKSFPDFNLPTLVAEGETAQDVDLPMIRSQIAVDQPWLVNVWGSWCPQCYVEVDFLEAMSDAGAIIIGMNYKDTAVAGLGFLNKMGNPYQVVIADEFGTLGLNLGVSGAPETYLVGREGQVLARHAGVIDKAVWDQKFAKIWKEQTGKALFE